MVLSDKEYKLMKNNLCSMGFESYSEYLLSDWWIDKRQAIFVVKKKRCQLCGSKKKVSIHHKTYEHLGNEPLKDLMILCGVCHEHEHNRQLIIGDVIVKSDI